MATTPDYAILARPRISLGLFTRILLGASSPAAPYAAACYAAAVGYGVDPAVLLAVFRKESSYGRAGVAIRSRSWGNLRRSPSYPTRDGFVYYPSWEAGARDAARLLAIYGRNAIRPGVRTSTVQTMPYVWAPTADGNAPDGYGDSLARWIAEWIAADTRPPAPPPAPRPPTTPTHRAALDGARLRTGPNLSAAIVATVRAGTAVRIEGTVGGATYRVGGRRSDRWHRIVARGGRRLARPIYSAALLWDAI